MTTQLLIYERALAVSKQRHRDWSIKRTDDYGFARHVNSVPLTAVEFPAAASEYAIVFAGSGEAVMPAVLLGVRERENVYVDDAGAWRAKYVPAFVRRYPFVFSSADDGARFTLCIDEEYAGFNQDGVGERLFDAEGEQTQYLGGVLEFLQSYQAQFQRTAAFCGKLRELELLEPMQAQMRGPSGEQLSLSGFMVVNREKLKALTGDQLAALARTDELELAYMQMQSMHNVRRIAERLGPLGAGEETAPVPEEATAGATTESGGAAAEEADA